MSDYERFFRKNLYLSLERHYTRILDGEDDSEGEGEGVTSVSQKTNFGPKDLWILFHKSHSSEKLIHNSTNPTP